MPEAVFSSRIIEGFSDPLASLASVETTHHSYTILSESRLWVMRALIEGDGPLVTLSNDINSGIQVAIRFDLVADDPALSDGGDFYEMEAWHLTLPFSYICPPGQLDLWIRIRNNSGGDFDPLMGNVYFGFIVLPELSGL